MDRDNDDIFLFFVGYMAGNRDNHLRPVGKWDVIAGVFTILCVIVSLVIALH